MKTFRVPVIWQMWGVWDVDAETIEEAEEEVLRQLPCPDGHYIEDSMEIDRESSLYGEITRR